MEQRTKKWKIGNLFKRKSKDKIPDKKEDEEIIKDIIPVSSPYDVEVKKVKVKKINIRE